MIYPKFYIEAFKRVFAKYRLDYIKNDSNEVVLSISKQVLYEFWSQTITRDTKTKEPHQRISKSHLLSLLFKKYVIKIRYIQRIWKERCLYLFITLEKLMIQLVSQKASDQLEVSDF